MIEHELLFLGLLKEGPKHGYEIKTKIREILSLFAGLDLKSVYYPLTILEKKGFITKQTVRLNKRPARIVYSLSLKGEKKFNDLLNKSLLNFKRPQFSLDLSLYFLHHLDPDIAKRRLRARQSLLKKLSTGLKLMIIGFRDKKDSQALMRILEHNRVMVEAELDFISGMIDKAY